MKKILLVNSFIFLVNFFVVSQPTETIAGRYEDHGFWLEHPYAMFNTILMCNLKSV